MGDDSSVWRVVGEPLAPATGSGPLDGLRVAVKDVFAVTGFARGAGNPTWLAEALPSAEDAAAVASLRAAGAVVAGLTQTEELTFGLSGTNVHYGTPPNPEAPELVTGGSSSGSASAVALGGADIGLGTDTAGSIRVPASCCGLFGLRPTFDAVSREGVLGLAPSFDTVGWMARDAEVLAEVGGVLLPPGPVAGPSTVLYVDVFDGAFGAYALDAAHTIAVAWEAEFEVVRPAWLRGLTERLHEFRVVQAAEAWALHGEWISAHPRALALDVEERFRFGEAQSASAVEAARDALRSWREEIMALLDGDAWLALPAAAGPGHARGISAPDKQTWRQATLRCAVPASAAGLPSLSVPTGGEQPRGVAFVGPPGADRALLEAALVIATETQR